MQFPANMNQNPIVATNAEYLKAVILFAGFTPKQLHDLGQRCTRVRLEAGDTLFHEGDEASALYVILAGRIRIEQTTMAGESQVIAIRTKGDVLGEMAPLEGQPRFADAVALSPCRMLLLSRADFEGFVLKHPDASLSLLRTMSSRLREMSERFADLRSKSVEERLLQDMRTRADEGGLVRPEGSQGTWAEVLGCTREVLNRTLQRLVKKGAIRKEGQAYRLLK